MNVKKVEKRTFFCDLFFNTYPEEFSKDWKDIEFIDKFEFSVWNSLWIRRVDKLLNRRKKKENRRV